MAERVCPFWVGFILVSPIRKLWQNPDKILRPYVKEGMQVLDIGCAMGFFSLPLARMVGREGKVVCVDLQEKMIAYLQKRASKADLSERIETRMCTEKSLGLTGLEEKIDFILASAVVHEVPEPDTFFSQVHNALSPNGQFLVLEPKGHVSLADFKNTMDIAQASGFEKISNPPIKRCHTVLLEKNKESVLRNPGIME